MAFSICNGFGKVGVIGAIYICTEINNHFGLFFSYKLFVWMLIVVGFVIYFIPYETFKTPLDYEERSNLSNRIRLYL